MKKLKKLIRRKKYLYLVAPIVMVMITIMTMFYHTKVNAATEYHLATDSTGTTWQYGYDSTNNTLHVSFFESTVLDGSFAIPALSFFQGQDSSIPNNAIYTFESYTNHNLGTPTAYSSTTIAIDLSNADAVVGIAPMSNSMDNMGYATITLNPTASIVGDDVFRSKKLNVVNLDKVTEVGRGAFYGVTFQNTSIELPNSNYVHDGSFQASNVTSLSINGTIGVSAFKDCSSLTTISFLNNALEIQAGAFMNTISSSVTWNNITTVGSEAFKYTYYNNGDFRATHITSIGPESFSGTRIQNLYFPDAITDVPYKAFASSYVQTISFNNVKHVGVQAFESCHIDGTPNFNRIEWIEYMAFAHNYITQLNLPKTLSVMNTCSIWYDNPLTTVKVYYDTLSSQIVSLAVLLDYDYQNSQTSSTYNGSKNVRTIELIAPYGTNETASISSSYSTTRTYLFGRAGINLPFSGSEGNNVLWNKELTEESKYKNVIQVGYLQGLDAIQTLTIGEGYEFIGARVLNSYYSNTSTVQISLPSTLKGIGIEAFENSFSSKPVSMNLPTSIEYIGYQAFNGDTKLTVEVYLPNLKHLGSQAFLSTGITGITYSNNLTYIGSQTAGSTPSLKKIVLDCDFYKITRESVPSFYTSSSYKNQHFRVMFPDSSNNYDLIQMTSNVKTNPTIDTASISNSGIFFELTAKTIDLENAQLTNLGLHAFHNSTITTLKLPHNLKTIDQDSFMVTRVTNSFALPTSLERLETKALMNGNMTFSSANLPNLTYLGQYAFSLSSSATQTQTITMSGLTTVENYAFYAYKGTSINLSGSTFTKIPEGFFHSGQLSGNIQFPSTLKTIGTASFFKAKINGESEIPNSVETIEQIAFMSSTFIASNNLPTSLKTIGDNAIADCLFNENVVIPASVTSIGNMAFQADVYHTKTYNSITRNSVAILCPIPSTVTNSQPISNIFHNNIIGELILGPNVTELPTYYQYSQNPGNNSCEFVDMNISKITMNNVHVIPAKTFLQCSNLEEVDLSADENLTIIGENAFTNTPALRNVKLRQGLDLTIKGCAFYNSGLVKLGNEYSGMDIVNNNITLDGEFIFSYMPNLTEVDFSSIAEDEVIPKGTFYHDLNLEKVVLDHTVQSVGPLAFASDPKLETFVMYGPTEIANKTPVKSVEVDGYNNYILLLNTEEDFTLTITDEVNGETIITSADFTNNKYTYQTNTTEAIPITIETTDNVFLDTMYGKTISITDIDDDVMTIPSTANLYCYSTHEECITYYENYKEYRDAAETDLYFLDEVIYLGSNKDHLDASDVNTGLLTDGLVVYALRRDGVILVSEEWQSLTDSAIFSDSGITMLSYDSSTTDPSKMVFHTTIPIEDVDVETNNNFENLEYVVEQDEETGEITINFQYQNIITDNQTEAEVIDSNPDVFRVVYADGCGGEAFANVIYIDLPLDSDTPVFEGQPTREGYEFIGWEPEIDSKVTKNIIYKALWKKIEKIYPDPSEDPNEGYNGVNPHTLNAKILLSLILLAFASLVYTFTRNKKYKKVLNH